MCVSFPVSNTNTINYIIFDMVTFQVNVLTIMIITLTFNMCQQLIQVFYISKFYPQDNPKELKSIVIIILNLEDQGSNSLNNVPKDKQLISDSVDSNLSGTAMGFLTQRL